MLQVPYGLVALSSKYSPSYALGATEYIIYEELVGNDRVLDDVINKVSGGDYHYKRHHYQFLHIQEINFS